MKRLLLIICIILTANVGFSATYYVNSACTDTNPASATVDGTDYDGSTGTCSTGSDSYYVSIADVNLADSVTAAGDSISFRRGQSWTGRIVVPESGTDGNPITYTAHGAGIRPIIDANSATAEAFRIAGKSYITVENMSFTGGTGNGVYGVTTSGFDCDNIILDTIKSYSQGGSGANFNAHSSYSAQKVSNITVKYSEFYSNTNAGISFSGGVWEYYTLSILNNKVYNNNQGEGSVNAIGLNLPKLTLSTGWAADGNGDYCQAVGNTPLRVFQDETNQRELAVGTGDLADGEWKYGAELCIDIGGDPEGTDVIYLVSKIHNFEITGNECWGTKNNPSGWDGVCIFADHGTEDGVISHNYLHDNEGGGIHLKTSKNIDATYNLLVNVAEESGWGIGVRFGAYDINLLNNTIINAGTGIILIENNDLIVIKNNILANNDTYAVNHSDSASTNVTLDYNDYFNVTTLNNATDGGSGITDDPLFVDSGNDKFWLQSESPCIGVGETLAQDFNTGLNPASDWPFSVVTQGQRTLWDMGAYMSGGTISGVTIN